MSGRNRDIRAPGIFLSSVRHGGLASWLGPVLGMVATAFILLLPSGFLPRASGDLNPTPPGRVSAIVSAGTAGLGADHGPLLAAVLRSPADFTGLDAPTSQDFAWGQAHAPPLTVFHGAGLAADPARHEAVLFGGANSSSTKNGTYVYSESNDTWRGLSTPRALSARSDFAMAADPAKQTALVFGGIANLTTGRLDSDTWAYDFPSATWTNVTHALAPPGRQDPAFAVSPSLGEGLLFGGWDRNFSGIGALIYDDMWLLNTTSYNWSRLPSGTGPHPPPLEGASLSWDGARGQFELFGGCFPCTATVWSYSVSTGVWSSMPASGTIPDPRASAAFAYDPAQHRDVLFGGIGTAGPLIDTYELDPASGIWTAQSLGGLPPARSSAAVTWMDVPTNETLLLAGGSGLAGPADLWRLAPVSNVSVLALDSSNLRPIPRATVTLDGTNPSFTNAHGFRNLTHVIPARHSISAIAPGYARAQLSTWVPPGSDFGVVVSLPPIPRSNLTVRVVDLNATPIAGADVSVTIQDVLFRDPPLQTDRSGFVYYTNIPTFLVNVTASARAYHPRMTQANLISAGTIEVDLQLTPYAVASVHVRGSLPSFDPGVSLLGAHVVAGQDIEGFADAQGVVSLQMLVQGPVRFNASAPGFHPGSISANAPYSGVFPVNMTLASLPYGTLHVLVLDSQTHRPIPAATINLTPRLDSPIDGFVFRGTTGSSGHSDGGYPPCNYSADVGHPGYFPNSSIADLRIVSSGIRSLTVNLTPLVRASLPTGTQGGVLSFSLLPTGRPLPWLFLVVPAVLLVAGGTYLSLLRGEPSTPRAAPGRRPEREPPDSSVAPSDPPFILD